MESGFGQNLEGFLIKGNLSLAPAEIPTLQGDGSIEASGTLYINNVVEYNVDNGVNIQNTVFSKDKLYVPYSHPSKNATSASFVIDGGISINHTENAKSVTSGGGLTIVGGGSIGKDLYVGGTTYVSYNNIKEVQDPVEDYDAVNKRYVDEQIENQKISGNFTTGQLIIADSMGDSIRGYDNLTFQSGSTYSTLLLSNDTSLVINSTDNAIGHGSGGSVNILGGINIDKDVYIGGTTFVNYNNIKEVKDPIEDYDAVNKRYAVELVNTMNQGGGGGGGFGNSFTMLNNTTDIIPNLYFLAQVKAFVTNIYVRRDSVDCALFTIYGSHNGDEWIINSTFVGENTGVSFGIITSGDNGYLQYINKNTSGVSTLTHRTTVQIDTEASSTQLNYTLTGNVVSPITIPDMVYDNATYESIQIIGHISSETDDKYTLFVLNIVQTDNNIWKNNIITLGDNTGIELSLNSTGTSVEIQYKNPNVANDYIIRVKRTDITTTMSQTTLLANTFTSTAIGNTDLSYSSMNYVFNLIVNVSVPDIDKYAMYHIAGLYFSDEGWKLNARYIGDKTDVYFQIKTEGTNGKLSYINKNNCNAYIRYYNSTPAFALNVLPVEKGGTGTNYLLPYAVLRGDGTNPVVATDDFIYKNNTLILGDASSILLKSTTNATSVTSGGTFMSNGGGSFGKDLYVGGTTYASYNNIKEVADPIEEYDAANKKVVDFIDITGYKNDDRIEYSYSLSNNVTVPEDIPNMTFSADVKSFITNIHIEYNNQVCALHSIHGINNGGTWAISSIFTGHPTGVGFNINTEAGAGTLQYTNPNIDGVTYIRYRTIIQVDTTPSDGTQINYNLLPNVVNEDVAPTLSFDNAEIDSVKLIIYVSSESDSRYGMFLINCILKGSVWYMNSHSIGNMTGVSFGINTVGGSGIVQYSNSNMSGDYVIRVKKYEIPSSLTEITLYHNTNIPTIVENSDLYFHNMDNYFQISIFVHVPDLSKYALYEIRGVYCNGSWSSNSRYVGDYTGIKFFITTSGNYGKLSYTNTNTTQDAFIKYNKHMPLASLKPLAINKGGTASTYLNPYSILRGNGVNPIVGTNDLIYKDYELILGNMSSVILQNTGPNTFVVFGGISINKSATIGEKLIVNNNDITPNEMDINAERSFSALNNQSIPQNVTGFNFGTETKSFTGMICTTISTSSDVYDTLFEIKGIKRSTGTWLLNYNFIGDKSGIEFNITSGGQMQYTSTNIPNWISTTMKFRAMTTTV